MNMFKLIFKFINISGIIEEGGWTVNGKTARMAAHVFFTKIYRHCYSCLTYQS